MSYNVIALENLTELKNRRGNPTSTTIATVLGLNYPMVEAYSVYWWDNSSLATGDDNEIVEPIIGPTGRWFKINLDQIPQMNVDWNSNSGITQILNKPTLSTVATTNDYDDLNNKPDLSQYYPLSNPSGYITSIPAPTWTSITGKPTTLSGYGITDPVVLTTGSYSNPSWITSLDYSKITNVPIPANTKRIETYSGTTDASGNFTITYSSAYSSTPYVNAVLINPNTQQLVRVTSSSTTGFTVNATNRATVNLLSTDLLLGNTTPLVGGTVTVVVIGN